MTVKILVMGLPGSGKTTLARELAYHFNMPHINADTIREFYDDWDFSDEGRWRQAKRMAEFDFGILDFVCPKEPARKLICPDYLIWMDTITESRYEDTNKVFTKPEHYHLRITQWIPQSQLRNSLVDFNPGTKGIRNYLNERLPRLAK